MRPNADKSTHGKGGQFLPILCGIPLWTISDCRLRVSNVTYLTKKMDIRILWKVAQYLFAGSLNFQQFHLHVVCSCLPV